MWRYPDINPVAFHLGPIQVHWYGIMYLLAFLAAYALAMWRARAASSGWSHDQVADLIFYAAFGVIIGGRLGYMLFYDLPGFMSNPLTLFKIWDGGMSFHGGLLGVMVAVVIFARKTEKRVVTVLDFIAPLVPIGLGLGRIGNFINGELWGRVTEVPWAMVFPGAGPHPRHPSQLYECLLEGVLLFVVMWSYSRKPRPPFAVSALFLIGYGSLRIFAEFFREPDAQYGYLAWGWLTMGQLLSLPMIIIGLIIFITVTRRKDHV